ncbi:MAG: NADH-quinone oxidoreductase subunit L, partial [Verrucomicrobia bacterium]|nr:NADH-quinone oxidoreductase subunit L [Verrucomicrobiota bacterium]
MNLEALAWITLLPPLAAAVAITLFTRRDGKLSAQLSIGAVVVSFLVSVVLFLALGETTSAQTTLDWLTVGHLKIEFGLRLDPLSLMMLLVVTGVGGAIHVYSFGYMREDRGLGRYFAKLSLFTFSMLLIVLANNFVELYIGWELVGVSSYLLIGFWYERPAAADAGKKAFLCNRLGDFGFLVGILLIWAVLGSVNFEYLQGRLFKSPGALGTWSTVAGLLVFCGAVGKSAQFPLHVWLPDAMEGPTPVSALIHAATMVAAGVYMLCRVFFLYTATPAWPASLAWLGGLTALDVIAWTGGITALLAAAIAVQQDDIKRILAYSTLSQLGYMVMAVGLHGPTAAMYHLTTHASFKALLFLGAGSVIVALHHEQDIWRMGGLHRRMPVTFWTFLVGTLALCGVPPFSGYFSKDAILATAYHQSIGLFVVGIVVAALTTFYMFRLVFVAFLGPVKSEAPAHAHESPKVMTVPLLLLAAASLLGGFWGIEGEYGKQLAPASVSAALPWYQAALAPFDEAPLVGLFGLGAIAFGFLAAMEFYRDASEDPLPENLAALSHAMRQRFYFDELYARIVAKTQDALARFADG